MTSTMPTPPTLGTEPTFGRFFLPGPTEVHPSVLQAMTQPMIAHRGKAFEALFARIQDGLRDVFRTERPVFVSSSSATGLMEAAVRCGPPGPVLAAVNGAFSERFANIVRATGRELDVLDVPWGRAVDPDAVAAMLRGRRYGALTVVHSETSTGVLSDVRALSAVAREAGVCCIVDSVTGVGGIPLHADAWQLDFALTGSQKALALPPGLALGVASAEYMTTAAQAPNRGLYFDLVEFEEFGKKNQTPNTPALSLLYALDAQLQRIRAETMEVRWARHLAMAERTHRWVEEREARYGIRVLPPPGERSLTVTTIQLPAHIKSAQVTQGVAARGWTIGGGLLRLKETTFRIGHMGDHTLDELEACLAVVDEVLASLG